MIFFAIRFVLAHLFSAGNVKSGLNSVIPLILYFNISGMPHLGKILILIGVTLVIAGLVIHFAGNKFSWIGHLPGDIRIEKENFKFYFPITTMILLSLLLTGILWIVRKLL